MSSPEFNEAHWQRLIRSVRGSRAAKVWFLYKTGRLEDAVPDQDNAGDLDGTGPPGPKMPDLAERGIRPLWR